MGPGVYAICCNVNGKVYFGESSNVVHRLGNHYNNLEEQTHECTELQQDWNFYGKATFSFISLGVGSEYKDIKIRRDYETELININLNKVYNQAINGSTPKKNNG
jgi:group I intron endonuclease